MHKKRLSIIFCFLFVPFFQWSQQNFIATSSFYKDKLFSPFNNSSFSSGSFLPVSESEINLEKKIADSTKQYYQASAILIKKHLIELKGADYYLTISPTFDFSYGKDKSDSLGTKLFQNTRGFHVEGDLFKNFSFSTSFYENQARFTEYERIYYSSIGELYPKWGGYTTENAVIPGGARTKPFKINGFDYAYAIGNIIYSPSKRIQLSTGNNSHFIGSGYRSLLLSDNSVYTPYIQSTIKISSKWSFVYMRTRLMNLVRRPLSTNVESYYEPKNLSINYLTYRYSDKLNFSLFEGIIWSKGDSVTSKHVNPLFYNPVIGISEFAVSDKTKMNNLLGLNIEFLINYKNRIYSQLAMSDLKSKNNGFQLGYRGYNFGTLKNFMLQLEYNSISKSLYSATNPRLNYSNYNLPLAHTKGNGFQEFIIRSNYEYRRFYIDLKIIIYKLANYRNLSLLPIDKQLIIKNGNLQHEQIEIGYRFNRKMNLTFFGSYLYRNDTSQSSVKPTQYFSFGIKTGLINHYNDF